MSNVIHKNYNKGTATCSIVCNSLYFFWYNHKMYRNSSPQWKNVSCKRCLKKKTTGGVRDK